MDFLLIYFDLINNYIEKNFIIAFIIFSTFLLIYISFSLPGNVIFFLFSGFLFDFIFGFLINLFTITLGSFIFYIFASNLLKLYFTNFYYKYSIKIHDIIKNSSYEYLILLRLIPSTPLIIQNLCLSISNISKIKFLITTFLGFIPLMFLTSYVGSRISSVFEFKNLSSNDLISENFLIISFFIIFLIILRIIFKKK